MFSSYYFCCVDFCDLVSCINKLSMVSKPMLSIFPTQSPMTQCICTMLSKWPSTRDQATSRWSGKEIQVSTRFDFSERGQFKQQSFARKSWFLINLSRWRYKTRLLEFRGVSVSYCWLGVYVRHTGIYNAGHPDLSRIAYRNEWPYIIFHLHVMLCIKPCMASVRKAIQISYRGFVILCRLTQKVVSNLTRC